MRKVARPPKRPRFDETPDAEPEAPPQHTVPETPPDSKLEFLREELEVAYHARSEAKAGSQAFAALSRQIRVLRSELDAHEAESRPTKGLTAIEILERTQAYARTLPEPLLAVFANEWAARHRTKWVPIEELEQRQAMG